MSGRSAENCLFCKIARGEIPARIVFEDERLVAFHDISPKAPTHLLIIPREHIPTIDDLAPEHAGLAGGLILAAGKLARDLGIAQPGYRLVFNCNESAGQTVWHIHLHLLGGRPLAWPPG